MSIFIKNITVFSVISGVVVNILPSSKTKRYVNLFISLVYIVMLTGFISEGASNNIGQALLSKDMNSIYVRSKDVDVIKQAIEECIRKDIEEYLTDREANVLSVMVSILNTDEGARIESINVVTDNPQISKAIKMYLCERYMLLDGQVKVDET